MSQKTSAVAFKPVVILALAALLTPPAFAEEDADDEQYIGVGGRLRPAYPGADSNRGDVIPYVGLGGEHWFATTELGILEGGLRFRPFAHVTLGAQLAYEEGRKPDESAFLKEHGISEIDPGVSAGVFAQTQGKLGPVPFLARLRYRQDVRSDNGAQADARVMAGVLDWKGLRAAVYGQLTWEDSKAAQTWFGLTPGAAAAAGLPAYSPGSGLRFWQLGVIGDVDIARHWIGIWGVNVQVLGDDAADSPLTLDRTGWYANAGIAYRF